jgi:hypothetical protein
MGFQERPEHREKKKYRKRKTESINLSQSIGGEKPLLKIGTSGR